MSALERRATWHGLSLEASFKAGEMLVGSINSNPLWVSQAF